MKANRPRLVMEEIMLHESAGPFPRPLASARAVRRIAPLDGLNAAPSRLTNEFAP